MVAKRRDELGQGHLGDVNAIADGLQDNDDELVLLISPQTGEYLDQLIQIGIFGGTREDVAHYVLASGIVEAVRDRLIELKRA